MAPPGSRHRGLQIIAAFKFLKAAGMIAVGFGALRLVNPDRAAWVQDWLEELALGHHMAATLATHALTLLNLDEPQHLSKLAMGAFLFAALFVVEGVGLALARRWAELLTVAVGISFLPVEVVAIWDQSTLARIGALVLNIVVVVYLIVQLRAGRRVKRPA